MSATEEEQHRSAAAAAWTLPCHFNSLSLMNCKSRAEAFAKSLHSKLKSLGRLATEDDQDEKEEEEEEENGGRGEDYDVNPFAAAPPSLASTSDSAVRNSSKMPIDERTRLIPRHHGSPQTGEDELYFDFDISSPESPADQEASLITRQPLSGVRNDRTPGVPSHAPPTSASGPARALCSNFPTLEFTNSNLKRLDVELGGGQALDVESGCISAVSSVLTEQDNDEDDELFGENGFEDAEDLYLPWSPPLCQNQDCSLGAQLTSPASPSACRILDTIAEQAENYAEIEVEEVQFGVGLEFERSQWPPCAFENFESGDLDQGRHERHHARAEEAGLEDFKVEEDKTLEQPMHNCVDQQQPNHGMPSAEGPGEYGRPGKEVAGGENELGCALDERKDSVQEPALGPSENGIKVNEPSAHLSESSGELLGLNRGVNGVETVDDGRGRASVEGRESDLADCEVHAFQQLASSGVQDPASSPSGIDYGEITCNLELRATSGELLGHEDNATVSDSKIDDEARESSSDLRGFSGALFGIDCAVNGEETVGDKREECQVPPGLSELDYGESQASESSPDLPECSGRLIGLESDTTVGEDKNTIEVHVSQRLASPSAQDPPLGPSEIDCNANETGESSLDIPELQKPGRGVESQESPAEEREEAIVLNGPNPPASLEVNRDINGTSESGSDLRESSGDSEETADRKPEDEREINGPDLPKTCCKVCVSPPPSSLLLRESPLEGWDPSQRLTVDTSLSVGPEDQEGPQSPAPDEEVAQRVRRSSSLKTCKTPPGTPNRKKIVRFADALGLDLEAVKHVFLDDLPTVPSSAFVDLQDAARDQDPVPEFPAFDQPRTARNLVPAFPQPASLADFVERVRRQRVCLESAVLAGDSRVRLVVRVLNLDFHKRVTVRYTTDEWATVRCVPADYVSGSHDGFSDKFATVVSADEVREGDRLAFAVQYETQGREFWDNNSGQNYCFHCFPEQQYQLTDDSWVHFL